MDRSAHVTFPAADGGTVTGRLRHGAAGVASPGAAVLCHPHPDAGGNMDVWLLPTIGEALAEAGWSVLRFDFRSVRDGARPDGHQRELADLAGAIGFLEDDGAWTPSRRLALIGWSFGALVALLHGVDDPRVTDWVGIAPPTAPLPELPMTPVPEERVAAWSARRTVIAGTHDQFFAVAALDRVHPHVRHVLDDCDHFFFDRDRDVAALVAESLR
jgi:alpha/beta superfamily hydrolase